MMLRDKLRSSVAVAVVLLLGSGLAQADRALTLEDALALARTHNRDLKAARARLDQSATGIELARAALLPTLVAQGKYTHNNKEVELALPGGPPVVILKGEELDFALTGTLPLIVPSAYSALHAAHLTKRSNDSRYEVTEATVLLGVARTYYTAAGSDELVRARTHAVEIAQQTFDDAKARVRADLANRVDTTRAETALVRAKQGQAEAENARAAAYRALATLLGTREEITVAPKDDPPATPGPVKDLVAAALKHRPELSAERNAIAAASASSRAAGWKWTPTLSAFGGVRAYNYAGFSGDKYAWAAGVELDWVLFDGGVRDAQRHLANAQKREAEAKLDQLTDSVSDDVANARGTLETKVSAVDAAQHALDLATETLRLVRAQYDAGAARQLDVLSAQDILVDAEVALVQARFDLALADLELRRVTGAFPGKAS